MALSVLPIFCATGPELSVAFSSSPTISSVLSLACGPFHAGPWRLAAQMGAREVSAALGIEQILDSVEVEKESVTASASEERVGAGLDDVGFGAEGDVGIGDDLRPSPGGAGACIRGRECDRTHNRRRRLTN